MLIEDISDWAAKPILPFSKRVEAGGSVKAIVAKNAAATYSRKKIDKLTEYAKGIGAKGLAYIRWLTKRPTAPLANSLPSLSLSSLLKPSALKRADCVFIISVKQALRFPLWAHCALSLPRSLTSFR
jgi:aspartyl-tRNA synthetase